MTIRMSFCSDIQLYLRLNLVFSLRMLSTLDAGFLVVNTSRENQPCMDVGEACSGPISTLHTAGSHLAVLPPPPPLFAALYLVILSIAPPRLLFLWSLFASFSFTFVPVSSCLCSINER